MCNPCPKSDERIITVSHNYQVMIRRASLKDTTRIANVNNLYFKDSHLSKLHASIKLENDKLYIMDCHSTFGTVLNFDYLLPGHWHEIKSGDLVGFIISRPSASINELLDAWTEPTTKIPLTHFHNPSIGLQFKVSIIDKIIKFEPIRLLKYSSLHPTTNEDNKADENTDQLVDSNENSMTQIIDSPMTCKVRSPIPTVTPKATPIVTPNTNTPKASTPVEIKSVEIGKTIPVINLDSDRTPEVSNTNPIINESYEDQEINKTLDRATHESEFPNIECSNSNAEDMSLAKNCVIDMDLAQEDEVFTLDEEFFIDEIKSQSKNSYDKCDSDSDRSIGLGFLSTDSSNSSENSFSSDSQSTSEESELDDESVSCSDNEISHADISDSNEPVPVLPSACFKLNDAFNPRKRSFESEDLEEDEDYCDEDIDLRHRPKKSRTEERFKNIAKEVGKALVYVLATITALGVYGGSLDKNQ